MFLNGSLALTWGGVVKRDEDQEGEDCSGKTSGRWELGMCAGVSEGAVLFGEERLRQAGAGKMLVRQPVVEEAATGTTQRATIENNLHHADVPYLTFSAKVSEWITRAL